MVELASIHQRASHMEQHQRSTGVLVAAVPYLSVVIRSERWVAVHGSNALGGVLCRHALVK